MLRRRFISNSWFVGGEILSARRSLPEKPSCCPLTGDSRERLASDQQIATIREHFPAGIAAPALRALYAAGYRKLADVVKITDAELLSLHGMGPKAVRLIREAISSPNS